MPALEAEWGIVAGDERSEHFVKSCDRTPAVMASRRPDVYGELVNQTYQELALARAEKEYLS